MSNTKGDNSQAKVRQAEDAGRKAQASGAPCHPGYDDVLSEITKGMDFADPLRQACIDAWVKAWREGMLAGDIRLTERQVEVLKKAGQLGVVSRGIRSWANGMWYTHEGTVHAGVAERLVEVGLLEPQGYSAYRITDAGRTILARLAAGLR